MPPNVTESFPGTTGHPKRRPIATGNRWETPDQILDRVRRVDRIALDPCTTALNPTKADSVITVDDDPCGLTSDWSIGDGLVFCNPPFGRGLIAPWAAKIAEESRRGCEIIALTRGDTSTEWARVLLRQMTRLCLPPRIKFRGAVGSPDFANLIFYFGPRPQTFWRAFSDLGPVVTSVNQTQIQENKKNHV